MRGGAIRHWLLAALIALMGAGLAWAGEPVSPAPDLAQTRQQVLVLLRLPPSHLRGGADYDDNYSDATARSARRRFAGRLARAHGLTLAKDWAMPLIGVDCYVMAVPASQSPQAMADALSHDRGVAWAEPMSVYHGQRAAPTPNDPLFLAQPAAHVWRLADLHQIATGKGVSVAVIDSMIDQNHPDLAGRIQSRENFVEGRSDAPERHGTGVAGVIAAVGNNGLGIAGIAPRAHLMALRACWQTLPAAGAPDTVCDTLGLAEALHFAVLHNAQVINLSLSGPPDPLLGKLIDVAVAHGATVVGAADPSLPDGGFPASHPGVVAVATDGLEAPRAGLYTAPGRDVPTTQPGGQWTLVNGSSFAAAHVSGLFALVRERAPGARSAAALVTARAGGGAIDTCATLLRASGPCDCACLHAPMSVVTRP